MTPWPSAALLVVVAGVAAAAAAGLALPPAPRRAAVEADGGAPGHRDPPTFPDGEPGWSVRRRVALAVLAGTGVHLFLGGPAAPVVGVASAIGSWVALGRVEPPAQRRRREAVRRELPHLVTLLAAALRGGSAPVEALAVVCAALPGPAAERLEAVVTRLRWGAEPAAVWTALAEEPELAPLGRALARAHETGAPVAATVERLAEELGQRARADVEDRARTVGVRAALPLGLCLLPAFLLVGIVPLVAGLLGGLTQG